MIKKIHSGPSIVAIGGILFLATSLAILTPERVFKGGLLQALQHGSAKAVPSWEFVNPELDKLVADLKKQQQTLAEREGQLKDYEKRLEVERAEITLVTQTLTRLQEEFDRHVLRIKEEEVANLKKLARIYAAMDPQAAASIARQMEDDQIVKFMLYMKEDEAAPVLENLSRLGEGETKRAAAISDRLRKSLFRNTKTS